MVITLAGITFDEAHTSVEERYEEVGGRNERRVKLSGLIPGKPDVAAIEADLDAILDAASVEDFSAELSLREGRRLFVRRDRFVRGVDGQRLVGSFEMRLLAKEPFEEAQNQSIVPWSITTSGQNLVLSSAGNVYANPIISLTAIGDIIAPQFSDGTRTIAYGGIVADSQNLVFDAVANKALLDGADITPYTTGQFPRIPPEGTTLTYTDDDMSSHTADVSILYRDRWW